MAGSGKEEPDYRHAHGKSPFISDSYLNLNLKKKQIKAVESPITRIFGGRFKSTLRAPGQRDLVLTEDWRSLRLDIQVSSTHCFSRPPTLTYVLAQHDTVHTIQEALTHLTHPQLIQMIHHLRLGVTIDASQRVLIDGLPPVLVLHVRFCYDVSVGGVVKVMKQVRFGPELEIGSGMCAFFCPCKGGTRNESVGLMLCLCRYDGAYGW